MGFAAIAGGALVWAGLGSFGPVGDGICFLIAAVGIQLRLLCNLFDGMVAVEGGFASKSGEIFNELPDRFSDVFILAGAGYIQGDNLLSIQLGWAAAALAIITAYVRALGASAGAGQQFLGPMAKPQRMAIMTGVCLIEAFRSWTGLADSFPKGTIMVAILGVILAGCFVTITRRTIRICRVLEQT